MKTNRIDRREFLRGIGAMGLGSSVFTLAVARGGWAAHPGMTAFDRSMPAMGTLVNVSVFGENRTKAREAVRDALHEIRWIDSIMSTHRRTSALSRLNRAAGSESVEVDARLLDVLRASLEWSRATSGLFDVTTLPLLRAWGFREGAEGEVGEAREKVGYRYIAIEGESVGLTRRGAEIDLGGIAKGYAVDRAIKILRDKWGIGAAIVEAGGDLYALGRPEDAAGWKIGLKHPLDSGRLCATFELADGAVATSGSSETRRTQGGRTFTDIFNPADGRPVESYLSLTTHAATAMDADAASTALFALGKSSDRARGIFRGRGLEPIASLAVDESKPGRLEFDASRGFPAFTRM